jgi:hypothetical protein
MGVGNGEGAKTLNNQQHLSISDSALIEKRRSTPSKPSCDEFQTLNAKKSLQLIKGKIKGVIKDYNQLCRSALTAAPPCTILAGWLFPIDRPLVACTPAIPKMCSSRFAKHSVPPMIPRT